MLRFGRLQIIAKIKTALMDRMHLDLEIQTSAQAL